MVILARTGAMAGNRGCRSFSPPSSAAANEAPFPDKGLSGGEIPVLGYRGMKDMSWPSTTIGSGRTHCWVRRKQTASAVMATSESARIQTAARAGRVAQNALELALAYATERASSASRCFGVTLTRQLAGWRWRP